MKHPDCPYCGKAAKRQVPLIVMSGRVVDWCCISCCWGMLKDGFLRADQGTPEERMKEDVQW